MTGLVRTLIALIVTVLPWPVKRLVLVHLLDAQIDASARIGLSVVIARRLKLGAGARIGHLNVIRGMSILSLGEGAQIGNLNWITALPEGHGVHFVNAPDRRPHLVLEEHATITNRHLVECSDLVHIGRFGGLSGFRSQILTHSVDLYRGRQGVKSVRLGEYSFVGTGCIILPGSQLPARSILAAGSVLTGVLQEESVLYRGNPAVKVRRILSDRGFFIRTTGFIE